MIWRGSYPIFCMEFPLSVIWLVYFPVFGNAGFVLNVLQKVEREHQYKAFCIFLSKILPLFLNWKLIFQFILFKDFMELHGKCRKGKTYTQSKNLFCRFVCHFYFRKKRWISDKVWRFSIYNLFCFSQNQYRVPRWY